MLNEQRTRGGAGTAPEQSENVPPTTAEEPCQNMTRASTGAEAPLAEVVKRTRGWPKGRPRGKKRPSNASTAENDGTGSAMDVDKLTDEPVPTKRTRGQSVEVQPVVRDDQPEESGQPAVPKRTRGRPPMKPVDSEEEEEGEDREGDNGEVEKQRRKKLAAAEEEESLMAMHALSQYLKGSTRNSQQVPYTSPLTTVCSMLNTLYVIRRSRNQLGNNDACVLWSGFGCRPGAASLRLALPPLGHHPPPGHATQVRISSKCSVVKDHSRPGLCSTTLQKSRDVTTYVV